MPEVLRRGGVIENIRRTEKGQSQDAKNYSAGTFSLLLGERKGEEIRKKKTWSMQFSANYTWKMGGGKKVTRLKRGGDNVRCVKIFSGTNAYKKIPGKGKRPLPRRPARD